MPTHHHLSALDPQQRQAATFGIEPGGPPHPPLLIAAGAGTGKTTTLAHRVAHLVVNGADPTRILLLTFTRRAAEDMAARAATICARVMGRQLEAGRMLPWSGTFHGIALRLLRAYAPSLGLDAGFTVLDRSDAQDLLELVRRDLGLGSGPRRFPQKATCLDICSYTVNACGVLEEVLARRYPWCTPVAAELARLFAACSEIKAKRGLLDYDDLLLALAHMVEHETLGREIRGLFDFVLVDEYQDTNPLQARIVRGLCPDGRGLTVVGDDQQAIYGFRAASVRNILDFPHLFDPPATVLPLERNYRSSAPILSLANAIQAQAATRIAKRLRGGASGPRPRLVSVADEAAQARRVAERVLALREEGLRLQEQAVLVRTAHHSAIVELELARRRIPYRKYGGLRLLEAAHVKDFLAFLRFAENPRDRLAGTRLLQLLPGVGPAFARTALDHFEAAGHESTALAMLLPPAPARPLWRDLVGLLEALFRGCGWPDQVARVRAFHAPLMAMRFDDHHARAQDLDQLELAARLAPSRGDFLAELALEPPLGSGAEAADPALDEDWLVLSTIHSAKGREWRAVYVLWLVDGWIPSDMASGSAEEIEEERRLLYVAVTRAREHLELIQPLRCHVHADPRLSDRYVRAPRSRFLTPSVLAQLDPLSPVRPAAPDVRIRSAAPADGEVLLDLAAKLRTMWR